MLDCKQTSQLISQSLDRKLTVRERFSLKVHLIVCKFCTRFSQHLQALRVGIKADVSRIENDTHIKLPPEAKARIEKALDSE